MDGWQTSFDAASRSHREIKDLLRERASLPRTSRVHETKTEAVREGLKKFDNQVSFLEDTLDSGRSTATKGEVMRRQSQVQHLRGQHLLLSGILADPAPTAAAEDETARSLLMTASDRDHAEPFSEQGQLQTRLDREEVLRTQDEGLDSLHEVIRRQRHLAESIGGEVEAQNEILDDIGDGMDQTRQRLIETTAGVRGVGRRDKTCGYWTVIVILMIVIVVIGMLPS